MKVNAQVHDLFRYMNFPRHILRLFAVQFLSRSRGQNSQGMPVLEDIVLWLALAIATATAAKAVVDPRAMSIHILASW
jgi:hypothetical protein